MYCLGFADEAGTDILTQIKATRAIGWDAIECRSVSVNGGKYANLTDISDADFDIVERALNDSGVRVAAFGSAIANWAKDIRNPFDADLAEVARAIPRMKRLGAKLIRIMSYPPLRDENKLLLQDQMEEERFRRLREIVNRFADNGLQVVHENCNNYGGLSWQHTLRLIENVPGLKLVLDTGNPVRDGYSAYEFYEHVREHIVHVHIKDGRIDGDWCFPGDGDGEVRKICEALRANGYDAGFSIEPHMSVVAHDDSVTATEEARYNNYVEYGRRFQALIGEIYAR